MQQHSSLIAEVELPQHLRAALDALNAQSEIEVLDAAIVTAEDIAETFAATTASAHRVAGWRRHADELRHRRAALVARH